LDFFGINKLSSSANNPQVSKKIKFDDEVEDASKLQILKNDTNKMGNIRKNHLNKNVHIAKVGEIAHHPMPYQG
jgi:hypothetical protein